MQRSDMAILTILKKRYILRIYRKDVSNMITAAIQKWGNSQGIRLTKQILAALDWAIDDEVSMVAQDNKLMIEKVHPNRHRTIDELFADFDGQYVSHEIDWGQPEGKEVW